MPCSSVHYSVARVKVLEKKILNRDKIDRMLSATDSNKAFKILLDSEYGGVPVDSPREFDKLIKQELMQSYNLINRITPDEELSDIFIIKYDYQNAKAYLKMKVSGTDEDNAITDAGKIDAKELREMVFEHDTNGLPEHLAKAIDEVIKQIAVGVTPQQIDTIMDRYYTKWSISVAKDKKSSFLKEYMTSKVDLTNILMMLRVRKMDAEFELLKESFIDGGSIEFDVFQKAYKQTDEAVPKYFKNTHYGSSLEKKIEEAIQSGRSWVFGKYMDNTLTKIMSKYARGIFDVEPVIAYLVQKENEATVIRMIMTGKLNNISQSDIKERLREINA